MLNLAAALLVLLPTTLALPSVPPKPTPYTGPGLCASKHLPIEYQYNAGVGAYCNLFLSPGTSIPINQTTPLTGTVSLPAYDNKEILPWVYTTYITGTEYTAKYELTYEYCMQRFKEVLSEGKVGGEYCVVEGTQDVLFQGGKVQDKPGSLPYGALVFESRLRRG